MKWNNIIFILTVYTCSDVIILIVFFTQLIPHSFVNPSSSFPFRAIEETATGAHDRPVEDVVISDCGVLQKDGDTEDEAAKI